ncbi:MULTISPECIES: LysR family substrate-binding domain-containing protein [unclassified Streptomyces]|uniref:LysR family substrate-binding domain-containing protein n=1 Tax=unclassified Streptomyces TaxID=2593676 RepID=UPI002ED62155|nr:LysR family substrate-binding domain-containing protein [Streptomyces sp. NBC_00891]WSY04526.1 LysR family substrate-binding domain-containing protein [Streptomyces sp. NBC_00890]WSZ06151.1 LysR family substrate-binding domain-containing protein [Streptomyces sp. NBC_00869]WSZ26353.1 LysR family substrate-binding domain-containing protein [Streptomyces sp. NBC_00870]
MTGPEATPSFRLAYVPGVTPTKWVRIWNERLPGIPLTLVQVPAAEAQGLLRAGEADAGFLRLPVDGADLSAIPLYTETTVVVIPKDHLIAAVDEVSVAELADEIVLHPLDDSLDWERLPGRPAAERPATTADAVELVAAGIGVLVVPQSLARLHHRKDLTYRTLTDAPESRIALSWPQEKTTDRVEDFIGIVRGRTVNSSRGRAGAAPASSEKAKAKDKPKRASGTGAGKGSRGAAGAAGGSGGAKGARSSKGARGATAKRGKPRRRP